MTTPLVANAFNRAGTTAAKFLKATDDASMVIADRFQELAHRGQMFSFSITAATVPVNAATLASKWGLYNPANSGILIELVDVEAHYVVATTVVSALGIYYSSGSNATGATFTTPATNENCRVGEGPKPVGSGYSAVTHVGTPALLDIVGGWGAVTDGSSTVVYKNFTQGKRILLPPATLIAFAMTTAASTASGISGTCTWVETPYVPI